MEGFPLKLTMSILFCLNTYTILGHEIYEFLVLQCGKKEPKNKEFYEPGVELGSV